MIILVLREKMNEDCIVSHTLLTIPGPEVRGSVFGYEAIMDLRHVLPLSVFSSAEVNDEHGSR